MSIECNLRRLLAALALLVGLAAPSVARAMPTSGDRFFPALPHRTYVAAPSAPSPRSPNRPRIAERAPSPRVRRRASEPTIAAVLSAAYAAAGLARDHARSDARRARLAGLVPWLTARAARATSWQDGEVDIGHSTTLELRATWRLDRLVFDSHELQLQNMETARRRQRRALASRVIHAYFAWRRAAAAIAARGGSAEAGRDDSAGRPLDAARRGAAEGSEDAGEDDADASGGTDLTAAPGEDAMTRLDETIAELDALTEGWFSDELQRARRRGREVAR